MSGLEPLLLIGAATSAIGGVAGAVGDMQSAQAEYDAAMMEADNAAANKVIANQERVQDITTAKLDAQDKAAENRKTLATLRANFGMSGGDFMGSPIEVLQDVATDLSVNEQRIRDEGRARNREGGIAMDQAERDRKLAIAKAKNAKKAGRINAFSSLLGGVGTALTRTA